MKQYKLAPHVTEQDLIKNCNVELICENGICRTTLRDMYSDDIDIYFHFDETRAVDSCGLDDYVIKDLVDKGIVVEVEVLDHNLDRLRLKEAREKQEKLLELYKELTNHYDDLLNNIDLILLGLNNYYKIKIIKLKQQIKELENEKV